MPDFSTVYMGLKLPSPIIASSSGLTNSLQDIIEIEKNGAGAIVLKSLFEEEIVTKMEHNLPRMLSENYLYPESLGFYESLDVEDILTSYLKLISDCKQNIKIPVIASINCITPHNWPYFAKSLQDAGADALELNISILPSNPDISCEENEKTIFDIIKAVKSEVTIPIAIKLSPYFSNLANILDKISSTNIDGLVLFNRYYSPDIDIDTFETVPASIYSTPNDYILPLRWISIMSNRLTCDLSASTGVHDGNALIKMILGGASSVQIASVLYKKGFAHMQIMLNELKTWMNAKNFGTIDEFKGMLSQSKSFNPADYIRVQFMKHYSQKA
jgi:dihydroorotate dehydrogenase (fumarate)